MSVRAAVSTVSLNTDNPAKVSRTGEDPHMLRRRSNSQSQVLGTPLFQTPNGGPGNGRSALSLAQSKPQKRQLAEFYITLVSLNDTFPTKHIHVPYYPDTCKLGRPTGTKVKPHVSNGYFDLRVLSRNHACMYVDLRLGQVMVQDMGSSNGTFVNLEKLAAEPVAVNVGDVINLGFNIQIETNHKQISARVENINMLSNNPKRPILEGLPCLTKNIIDTFSEAEMKHYDFIQGLLAQALGKPAEPSPDTDPDEKSLEIRAFDRGMFSDIVPSLEDTFAASSDPSTNAGMFQNSKIVNSQKLLTTLDYMNSNLARMKQQNSMLQSLETFLAKYSSQVNEINASQIKKEVEKHEHTLEGKLREERSLSVQTIKDQDRKITEQAKQIKILRDELSQLKQELKVLTEKLSLIAALEETNTDNELSFHQEISLEPGSSAEDLAPSNLLSNSHGSSENDTEQRNINISSSLAKENPPSHTNLESSIVHQTSREMLSPYVDSFQRAMGCLKNQGVLIGFVVVVAGFMYQNSR